METLKKFFKGLKDLLTFGAKTDAFLNRLNERLDRMEDNLTKMSKKIDNLDNEMTKVKDGLQIELFSSLQVLHYKLKLQHYATIDDKKEAKLYYDQIHNLGKDGWSQKYYDEIIEMPESRDEYWETVK